MRILASMAFLATVLSSTWGEANNLGRSTYQLRECGGQAQLMRQMGGFTLVFSNVQKCSEVTVDGRGGHKLQGGNQPRYGTVYLGTGKTSWAVQVQSTSGKTSDYMVVTAPVAQPPRVPSPNVFLRIFPLISDNYDVARLPSCGGEVSMKITGQGQVTLKFDNVTQCSNFDILGANGQAIDYPNKKLQGKEGDRSGSFSLPKRLVDFGFNGIIVVLKSNSGKHDDVIKASFLGL